MTLTERITIAVFELNLMLLMAAVDDTCSIDLVEHTDEKTGIEYTKVILNVKKDEE